MTLDQYVDIQKNLARLEVIVPMTNNSGQAYIYRIEKAIRKIWEEQTK